MIRSIIPDSGTRKLNTKFTDLSFNTWQVVFVFSAWPSLVLMYIRIQHEIIMKYCGQQTMMVFIHKSCYLKNVDILKLEYIKLFK